jgi:hypothetical protein
MAVVNPAQIACQHARRTQTVLGSHLSREEFEIFEVSLAVHLGFVPFRPGFGRVLP